MRYDENGKALHSATFERGNLMSGTVLLKGNEVGSNINYIKVMRDKDILSAKFYDIDNNKVFSAEENMAYKGNVTFMQKLYVYLDYLNGNKLY